MNFLTDKKTLMVGTLSLVGGIAAAVFGNQQNSSVPFFTQSASATHLVASQNQVAQKQTYILQGATRESLTAAIENVGSAVSREFPIISAMSAMLTESQVALLSDQGLIVTADRQIKTAASSSNSATSSATNLAEQVDSMDNLITTQTQANVLHNMGITGRNITVAVLDSGTLYSDKIGKSLLKDSSGSNRAYKKYNAILSTEDRSMDDDLNGHGTHVSSIIASSLIAPNGNYNGIAPDAYLLSVKAFNADGEGSYTSVLDGLNWIYENSSKYQVRVLNLSLGAEVQSNYWNDPINQAVMRLWDAGVVVVTSAGNSGSDNATITVPGNTPYVITVGALTDSYTPTNYTDDRMTSFSSLGPTHEGFVKPELVSWGGHIEAQMDKSKLQSNDWFASLTGTDYYAKSGTSQAAAVVAGIVALVLDDDPALTPDDVKCRLMSASQPVQDPATGSYYSPLVQGAGLVNAYQAVMSNASGCANRGLNIEDDIAGIQHFKGPVLIGENDELMIDFGNGNVIAEGSVWGGGTTLEGSVWGGGTTLESSGNGATTGNGAGLEGSVWGGGTNLEGSVWGGGTMLEGSVWGGGTVLEGSVWGGGTNLEGSVWGGGTNLEGSVWGGGTNLEGSVWGGGANLEGSVWGGGTKLEGSIWGLGLNLEGTAEFIGQE